MHQPIQFVRLVNYPSRTFSKYTLAKESFALAQKVNFGYRLTKAEAAVGGVSPFNDH